jgi:hypothetical protein
MSPRPGSAEKTKTRVFTVSDFPVFAPQFQRPQPGRIAPAEAEFSPFFAD